MRVLVVDDARSVRTRLAAMLAAIPGVDEVKEACGATDALETLRSQPHDIVVLDLHLADGNGLDLAAQLKSEFPTAFLYVMTNDATEHHRRQVMALGAHAFLDKSKDFDALAEVVGEAARTLARRD